MILLNTYYIAITIKTLIQKEKDAQFVASEE